MMDTNDITEKLNDLMHLDVDAVRAYEEAIEKIDNAEVKSQLSIYRADHERHVQELRRLVTGLGGEPEEAKPDAKGLLVEGMTKLRSSMGDEQALKAMHQAEEITNREYRAAVSWEVPSDVHEVLLRGYDDEKRHLAYVDQQLSVGVGSSTGQGSMGGQGMGARSGY
jgi:uncharacterized protein (TIGR02284 family)